MNFGSYPRSDADAWALGTRARGTASAEQAVRVANSSRKGERRIAMLSKGSYPIADSGAYFVLTNPTPGTGIAGISATGAFSHTESLCIIKNRFPPGGPCIYLDYLQLIVTAAGADGTDHQYRSLHSARGAGPHSSGGSFFFSRAYGNAAALSIAGSPQNVNADSGRQSGAFVAFGAVTGASDDSIGRTYLQGGVIRPVITVVGDVYTFDFGAEHQGPYATKHAIEGTAVANIVIPHQPVIIAPLEAWNLQLFATAQSAATSYEFNMGWWEL